MPAQFDWKAEDEKDWGDFEPDMRPGPGGWRPSQRLRRVLLAIVLIAATGVIVISQVTDFLQAFRMGDDRGLRMRCPDLLEAFARGEYGEALPGWAYHNQWWVRDPQRGVIMALGIHGQTLYIDPGRDFVVAKFSSQPAQADVSMVLDQIRGFEAIAQQVGS